MPETFLQVRRQNASSIKFEVRHHRDRGFGFALFGGGYDATAMSGLTRHGPSGDADVKHFWDFWARTALGTAAAGSQRWTPGPPCLSLLVSGSELQEPASTM